MVTMAYRTIAILQARMSSSRLPGKVMMEVNGKPMIYWQVKRILQAKSVNKLIIATSIDPSDDALADFLKANSIEVYRGSLNNVFSRYCELAEVFPCDALIRLTGDCPLVMPQLIDEMVEKFYEVKVDYLSNTLEPTFPDGLDIEIIKPTVLKKLSEFKLDDKELEHVTCGVYTRPQTFSQFNYSNPTDRSSERWTVDYQEDIELIRFVFEKFSGSESKFSFDDVTRLLADHEILGLNAGGHQVNESVNQELVMNNGTMGRYARSIEHLYRAEKTIPLGSQTFSKSRTQYPVGISPLYASKANGSRITDIDGNVYIDLVSALASVTLGYGDKAIARAVKKQLKSGVSMSLPGKLEAEVAELIVDFVPSAEMVRFGKNGSDATSAAVRLARAFTGRDHIAVCGYHGWQDWFIGTTSMNKGVPDSVASLTHNFVYNDVQSLEDLLKRYTGKVAAVIMEPMNAIYPVPGYLEKVKELSHAAGALLVFDETITGFRFDKGGAQEFFNVTPDLSTFGKGMANGFPLSAIVGRRDVMMEMEKVFFSGTFGGELLSLAAAKSVLERHIDNRICETLHKQGSLLTEMTRGAVQDNKLEDILILSGHPSWKFLNWKATEEYSINELKTYFMQECFKRGLIVLGTHNITTSFNAKTIDQTIRIYYEVFENLHKAISLGTLKSELQVEPLLPLFRVR
jgi:glutamate-1-semialdehyde 2,1-aminomutase